MFNRRCPFKNLRTWNLKWVENMVKVQEFEQTTKAVIKPGLAMARQDPRIKGAL